MPKTLPMIDMSAPVCCAPVAAGPMSDDDALHVALRLKALADPARVKIMSYLFSAPAPSFRDCQRIHPGYCPAWCGNRYATAPQITGVRCAPSTYFARWACPHEDDSQGWRSVALGALDLVASALCVDALRPVLCAGASSFGHRQPTAWPLCRGRRRHSHRCGGSAQCGKQPVTSAGRVV